MAKTDNSHKTYILLQLIILLFITILGIGMITLVAMMA